MEVSRKFGSCLKSRQGKSLISLVSIKNWSFKKNRCCQNLRPFLARSSSDSTKILVKLLKGSTELLRIYRLLNSCTNLGLCIGSLFADFCVRINTGRRWLFFFAFFSSELCTGFVLACCPFKIDFPLR